MATKDLRKRPLYTVPKPPPPSLSALANFSSENSIF